MMMMMMMMIMMMISLHFIAIVRALLRSTNTQQLRPATKMLLRQRRMFVEQPVGEHMTSYGQ